MDELNQHQLNSHVSNALYWLRAVVYQAGRVRAATEVQGGKNSPFRTIQTMEEHFFLVALNKARRWIDQLSPTRLSSGQRSEFEAISESARVMRNKREHDEDYFGKNSKGEPMHKAESDGALDLSVGTSVTVLSGGRVLLGGIVDVDECSKICSSLADGLAARQRSYWSGRGMEDELLTSYCTPEPLIDV